ncbi:MAG: hypothetical protein IKI75_07315 [Lachnospiraceae bacterium]|nr:hypothetical protein [Lachnospiraceae bacterium]
MKKLRRLIVISVLAALLSGCVLVPDGSGKLTYEENVEKQDVFGAGRKGEVVTLTPATGYEEPVVVEEAAYALRDNPRLYNELMEHREECGVNEETIAAEFSEESGNYMFDHMPQQLRRIYAEVYLILLGHGENVLISTTDPDELYTAFHCVFQDHPELFWIDGYSYRRYGNSSGKTGYLTFSGKYIYNAHECELMQDSVEDYAVRCRATLPAGAGDYEKVKHVYEMIIDNTDYVIGADNNQNILSVFLSGRSVCQGYAKAVQYLLKDLGVDCTMVVGRVSGGEGHAWDLVVIDGEYYYLDATWGDSGYLASGGRERNNNGEINYNYLNITGAEISLTHTGDNVVEMPDCAATEANYYVREGFFLEAWDPVRVKDFFSDSVNAGARSVSFKCADREIFETAKEELLTNREVFTMLPDDAAAIDYSADEGMLVLSFWF